jgi:diguanylate cyclase (GGDEF)-like protein/PAS domain S-box-containing protein
VNEARFRTLIEEDRDIMMAWGIDGALRFANPALEALLGYSADEYAKGPRFDLIHPDDRAGLVFAWEAAQATQGTSIPFTARARTAAGGWIWLEGTVRSFPDASGGTEMVLTARDMSAFKRLEAEVLHLTLHDPLTELPNRSLLMDRLEQALREAHQRQELVGVLSVGLDDHLEQVNARHGHAAGDAAVQTIARRLAGAVRVSDTVARIGGDEFVVLLPEIQTLAEASTVAERLYELATAPITWQDQEVPIDVYIGIAVSLPEENDPEALLRDAAIARLESRRTGRDHVRPFSPQASAVAGRRVALMSEIRRAIRRDELRLDYQPIIELATGRIAQLEALVRWQHPLHGLISPADFIPAAEATGQIFEIGHWVIGAVCRQLALWGTAAPPVSVNLSAAQFSDPRLVPDIVAHLAEHGVPPEKLAIEITEYVLAHDLRATAATLRQLRQLGVSVAIDDFGSGYSSLRYLHELPVAAVKLDRTFACDLDADRGARAIVNGITSLAHAIDLVVTAEGIETKEQLAFFQEIGCDHGQGFFIARPTAGTELPSHSIPLPR